MTHQQVLLIVQGVLGVVLLGAIAAEYWKLIRLRREMLEHKRRMDALQAQSQQIRDKYMQDRAAYRCMHCARRIGKGRAS
jgi:hypothetical protein